MPILAQESGVHAAELGINAILWLLVVVAVVALLSKIIRLPYTLTLVIAGLSLALLPNSPKITLTPDLILFVFLPALLFEGAYNVNIGHLRENAAPIALLALPGVLATVALIAVPLVVLGGFAWPLALLVGAILSATDPISVLALFKQLGAPRRLATIIEGESLFNDGTALVVFNLLIGIVVGESVFSPVETVGSFLVVAVGGIGLGMATGFLVAVIMRRIDDHLTETVLTVILAYGTFLLAERFGLSPALAVVAAGLVTGNFGTQVAMSATTRITISLTWEFIGFVANSLIFLLVGLQLDLVRFTQDQFWQMTLLAIVAMIVSRVLLVPLAAQIACRIGRHNAIPLRWQPVMIWGGLRGSLSLALALSLPIALANRALVLEMVFGVILFSLLGQGLTIGPLVRKLGLSQKSHGHEEYETLRAQLQVNYAMRDELQQLERQGAVAFPITQLKIQELDEQRRAFEDHLVQLSSDNQIVLAQQTLGMERRLLHIQRNSLRTQLAQGTISEDVYRPLATEADARLIHIEAEVESLRETETISPHIAAHNGPVNETLATLRHEHEVVGQPEETHPPSQ